MTNALDRIAAPAAITQTTAVEQARAVAEVAAAVQVAQQCPRDVRRAWAEMEDACRRYSLAERAFYQVPNRGRGASVHLARELGRIWGNLDAGVHELSRDDERGMSEIRAYAWDQQTNVRTSRTFQVPHRRMGGGAKLTDLTDIYLNNQNIGARAVRECIFAALPADFVERAQDICRETLKKGDGTPLLDRIAKMVEAFAEIGVSVARIETRIGRPRGQWTAVDVADMLIVFRSIGRGETTADAEFPAERVTAAEITGQHRHPADGRPITPGYMPDPDAERKAAEFPGFVDPTTLVIQDPDWVACGFQTPDGACNLRAGHPTGPELPGYDGHDVVPGGGQ
jgi:hypothetical protein